MWSFYVHFDVKAVTLVCIKVDLIFMSIFFIWHTLLKQNRIQLFFLVLAQLTFQLTCKMLI